MHVLVPIKRLDTCKQRLSGILDAGQRRPLMLALLEDALAQAFAAQRPTAVSVVTDDPLAAAGGRGLRGAARLRTAGWSGTPGCATRWGCCGPVPEGVLFLSADLPTLVAGRLDAMIEACPARGIAIGRAHDAGHQRARAAAAAARSCRRSASPRSSSVHAALARAAGVESVLVDRPGLALDLDTPDDLTEALAVEAFAGRAWRHRRRGDVPVLSFGATILPDPPCSRFVELVQLAEQCGFDNAWTYDSHVLWQDGSVFLPRALAATERIRLGFCVTNPGTREPTVSASYHATLNDMYPGRIVHGIGRGDSARRTIGYDPVTVGEFARSTALIRELMNGRPGTLNDKEIVFEWAQGGPEIPIYVAGYGPKVLAVAGREANGVIIQLADLDIIEWIMDQARAAAAEAGPRPGGAGADRLRAGGAQRRPGGGPRAGAVVPGDGLEPRRRPAEALRPVAAAPHADRVPAAARVLRLLGALPRRSGARVVRRRRDLRPVLHPRLGRRPRREAAARWPTWACGSSTST